MGFVLKHEEYNQIKQDLDEFLDNSEARTALLLDRGGNIIISSGNSVSDSIDMVSALVAGAFAATKELATLLGEKEFSNIFHQGSKTSIFISSVGEEVLLLALFSDETNAGLVKMYALTTCRKCSNLFKEIMTRKEVKLEDLTQSFTLAKGPIFRS